MERSNGYVRGGPLVLLRLEGAAILVVSLLAYGQTGQSWWTFAALILAPDLSMLGYLVNARAGAASYNAVHTLTGSLMLLGLGLVSGSALILSLSLIWLAHIGLDRMLGFGLKYASGFSDTHLGLLGIRKEA
ncbi:DUF4260 domain-containing protein [Methyloferula stellata]|uniref:DUF4260 domain-containing protein n=1 Tax=Methyloferula stellata TaxID=876270 RepID=UPI000366AF9D|nr:DUF4260 domain-containing protein [Methyloferula stellata]